MATEQHATCPVDAEFDPLSRDFLADPFAALARLNADEAPVFYAPEIPFHPHISFRGPMSLWVDPRG